MEEAYDNASNEEDEEACSDTYKEDYDKATYITLEMLKELCLTLVTVAR